MQKAFNAVTVVAQKHDCRLQCFFKLATDGEMLYLGINYTFPRHHYIQVQCIVFCPKQQYLVISYHRRHSVRGHYGES